MSSKMNPAKNCDRDGRASLSFESFLISAPSICILEQVWLHLGFKLISEQLEYERGPSKNKKGRRRFQISFNIRRLKAKTCFLGVFLYNDRVEIFKNITMRSDMINSVYFHVKLSAESKYVLRFSIKRKENSVYSSKVYVSRFFSPFLEFKPGDFSEKDVN